MAALAARRAGAAVVLLEPNEKLGRKLYITGKGRCNLTNNTTPEGVLAHVTRNGRFLYSAVTRFPPAAVMEYFEALGVPLKTERGGRVFPCSDRAADVIDALFFALKKEGVVLRRGKAEELRLAQGRVVGVSLGEESLPAGAVILATGGLSYPATGSTGDGYRLAQSAGHTIVPPHALSGSTGGGGGHLRADAGTFLEKCDPDPEKSKEKSGLSGAGRDAFHPLRPLRAAGAQCQRPCQLEQGYLHRSA